MSRDTPARWSRHWWWLRAGTVLVCLMAIGRTLSRCQVNAQDAPRLVIFPQPLDVLFLDASESVNVRVVFEVGDFDAARQWVGGGGLLARDVLQLSFAPRRSNSLRARGGVVKRQTQRT